MELKPCPMCHTPSGGLCVSCARITAKGEPQTQGDFIAAFPERDGISVYACALFIYDLRNYKTYVLGETSTYIWNKINPKYHLVLDVIYAGNDRNEAIRIQDTGWSTKIKPERNASNVAASARKHGSKKTA